MFLGLNITSTTPTLCQSHVATDNGHFNMYSKSSMNGAFSIAMLNYQRVPTLPQWPFQKFPATVAHALCAEYFWLTAVKTAPGVRGDQTSPQTEGREPPRKH